jgi:hypothetical protein
MVTTPTSRQSMPGRDYGVIALVVLLAVVVGAVAAWYLATDDGDSATTTEVAPAAALPAASTSAEADLTARGGQAEMWDSQAPSTSATPAEPVAVYVVDSEAAADQLRSMLGESDAIRAGLGLPPIEARFVVLPPDADAWAMFRDEQAFRSAEGMPDIQVHDLRPSVTEAAAGAGEAAPVDQLAPHDALP